VTGEPDLRDESAQALNKVAGTGGGLHRLGGRSGLKTNFGGVAWKCATYRANTHGPGAFKGAEIMD